MATGPLKPSDDILPPCRPGSFALLKRPLWILDTGRLRKFYANAAAMDLWGVSSGEEEEFFSRDFTPHSEAIRKRLTQTIERVSRGEVFDERWTFYPRDRPFTVDCTLSGVRLPNGNVGMLVEAIVPQSAPEELRAAEALRHIAMMVTLYDDSGRVLYRNPAAARSYPDRQHRFLTGFADPAEGEELWCAALAHDPRRTDAFKGASISGDFRVLTATGERWHGIYIRTTTDPVTGQLCALVNESDVTDRVLLSARAEFLAGHDPVTGLANRTLFNEKLEAAMADPNGTGGVLMIDLDGFKEINDTHGHAVGDVVLNEVGRRLRANARPQDLCARLGGDEFAMILPGLSEPDVLHRRAQELHQRIFQGIEDSVSGTTLNVSASLGAALWPVNGATPDTLQRNADLALYASKADRGSHIRYFDITMRRVADERRQCIDDLWAGLDRGEFEVYFQPQVGIADARPIGFEALVRWQHPTRGLLLPGQFVAAAESVGLMAPIGAIVLDVAARRMHEWLAMGLAPGRLAVNLSSNQFRNRDLAAEAASIVAQAGLTPDQVEFEVPETVTLGRSGEGVLGVLFDLRRAGFRIALDDFGTGYASLTHLRRLPVDTIKLDRSFVIEMHRSLADRAIVRALVGLGHDLGLKVLAEGIETPEQLEAVVELGCDFGQGFLFGRPLPAEQALDWLRTHRSVADGWGKVISFPG